MELEPLEAREAFNDSQKEIKLKEVNKNYSKYLTITKNEVHTKFRAIVRLPLDEYKVNDNEMLNKEDFEMIAGDQSSYSVPGTFEIEFPEEGISLNIFLPYNINIMKTEDSTINSKEMVFNYEEGDLIFNAFVKKIETNIEILNSMFENRVRYLRGYISEQHEAIWSQMASTSNVKAIHIYKSKIPKARFCPTCWCATGPWFPQTPGSCQGSGPRCLCRTRVQEWCPAAPAGTTVGSPPSFPHLFYITP